MNQLEYGLRALLNRRKADTKTRSGRQRTEALRSALVRTAAELRYLGYSHMAVGGLQQKHVKALVAHWVDIGNKPPTIARRLSAIRWWARQVDRETAVARSNKPYGLDETAEVVKSLTGGFEEKLSKVTDPYVKMSLRLQGIFGLNTMESIKFTPRLADSGRLLNIKNTWRAKSPKRARIVRCEDPLQRLVLDEAKALAAQSTGALIAPGRNYIEQYRVYDRHLAAAGFSLEIGGRYQYVFWRYEQLTGQAAPAKGGPRRANMSFEAQRMHRVATRQITTEVAGLPRRTVGAILNTVQ